jgi:transcriptional regulator with XRE-family HTH domain
VNSNERVLKQFSQIGKNLKNLREIQGCSQRQIADILGVTFQQVQKYEKGANRLPLDKLHALKIFKGI